MHFQSLSDLTHRCIIIAIEQLVRWLSMTRHGHSSMCNSLDTRHGHTNLTLISRRYLVAHNKVIEWVYVYKYEYRLSKYEYYVCWNCVMDKYYCTNRVILKRIFSNSYYWNFWAKFKTIFTQCYVFNRICKKLHSLI